VVYFGSVDGAVYALEAGTGKLRWRYQTDGPVASSPVVADGVVYVGSLDGCLYALRA
jgi:outer membrane protein assembly factor BamB